MSDKTKPTAPPQSIPLKADEATQSGAYANMTRISHDAESFVLDFLFVHSSPPFGRLVSRVVLTPGHAKRLAQALSENLKLYESSWGAIRVALPPQGSVQ